MNAKKILLISLLAAALLGLAGAGAYALYALGLKRGMDASAPAAAAPASAPSCATPAGPPSIAQGENATRRHISAGLKAGDIDPASGRKILYYHDPMVPGNKFDKPAKSPFMDMMLVPVYADGDTDQGKVTVSPRIQQNLGVRTALVKEGTLSPELSAVGSIAFNERDQVIVQARANAYVERLRVRATLDSVTKGQTLAELYVPDWVAAQEEFLAVGRMQGTNLEGLVDGALQRMRQVGMSEAQISEVQTSGQTRKRIALIAPISGVITELSVREGMTVAPGATLFRINGLSTVWANAEVPESQAALLRPGAKVQAKSPAVPGTLFSGSVEAILPEVNASTRTLKARVALANPGSRLVPGMFVQMQFMDMRADKVLLIPTEAVIQTGKRAVVILAEKDGRFRPAEVDIGIESGGQTEIKRGLQAGQQVVVSSQFLIDSEASLKGVEARLNGHTQSPQSPPPPLVKHHGEGKVVSIDQYSALLAHGPLPTVGMGAMTMEFKAPANGMPRNIARGDQVQFEFVLPPDGEPTLTSITPTANAPMTAPVASRPAGSKP